MSWNTKLIAIFKSLINRVDAKVEKVKKATIWIGTTTTQLVDGATTNPIIIDGDSITAEVGNVVSYNGVEFVYNGEIWQEFGGPIRELTQAQYDALSQAEKNNGTLYFITDSQAIYKSGVRYANDYAAAVNKPSINGVTLIGDKITSDLGLASNDYVNDRVAYAISQAEEEMRAYTDSAIEDITDFESEVFPNG